MNKKWLLFLLILFLILWINISLATTLSPVEIGIRTISEDYPALKAELQIPVFQGFQNEVVAEKIQQQVENDIFHFLNNLVEDSNDYIKKAREAGWQIRKYIGETIFELHYLSPNILSFSLVYYSYTLGAHGFTEKVSYNFDLLTGEKVTIDQLFINYTTYKDIINREIKRKIFQEKEVYFSEGTKFTTIKEDQPFYIEYDGIVIYFGLYEIAPYAAGIRYFKIPFRVFDNLRPENLRYFGIN